MKISDPSLMSNLDKAQGFTKSMGRRGAQKIWAKVRKILDGQNVRTYFRTEKSEDLGTSGPKIVIMIYLIVISSISNFIFSLF